MKQNGELQRDVQEAIKWEPLLHAAEIGVIARDGVITLTGLVDSFSKKAEAEDAAKNVAGVKAVIEKIEVQTSKIKRRDEDIAHDILKAFQWTWEIPHDRLRVEIEDGWVTIFGEVSRNSQREAARKAVRYTAGVKGITNDVIVKSDGEDAIEKEEIKKALLRNWSFENAKVEVNVTGNKVTLKGLVHSVFQRDEAGRIAWNAPGVWDVENQLVIE